MYLVKFFTYIQKKKTIITIFNLQKDSDTSQLKTCVELLLKLEEPADVLCDKYLQHYRNKLESNLKVCFLLYICTMFIFRTNYYVFLIGFESST